MAYGKGTAPLVPSSKPGTSLGSSAAAAEADAAALEKLCEIRDLLANPTAIESSFASLGCIPDGNGGIEGKVFGCKHTDTSGVVTGFENIAIRPNQAPERNYDGPWIECSECQPSTAQGVLTSWN